jgi:hypothetical protein
MSDRFFLIFLLRPHQSFTGPDLFELDTQSPCIPLPSFCTSALVLEPGYPHNHRLVPPALYHGDGANAQHIVEVSLARRLALPKIMYPIGHHRTPHQYIGPWQ